ncbi:MAG TPA: hypothetical protein VK790_09155 [Solirubrobacteraceae bacterium]|jgi:hypothetical protein|nr:hypothetical protein [Solirubrobacteraceae bacterium]
MRNARTVKRPRRYIARHWLAVARPLLRYSAAREAYVLRVVGRRYGPVVRPDRRAVSRASAFSGADRRRASAA